ncbi:entericidin A/B family lipoprotein [Xinfangfangia sp. D13-10-4-6]|nr:entericidin A/B family lipoprotein [Pseudogemmobacter hezensis]NPD15197.1 entericidin A/B family lipoprotein [Pseudogemmobacter hezensis]
MRPTLILSLLAIFATSACNTIAGAGRDMQDAGHAITSEARKTEADM